MYNNLRNARKVSFAIKTGRVHDPVSKEDGVHVFVEILWPRSISKENAVIDFQAV